MKRQLILILLFFLITSLSVEAQQDKIMELGLASYQSCAACHGPDGKGVKAGDLLMAPSLHDSAFVKGGHSDLLTGVILKGIHKEDNKYIQIMLALEEALNNEQIASVIAYVTSEFGEKRQSPTANDVAKWRKQFARQTGPWRREDLQEMVEIANAPKIVSDLSYSLYQGKWEELPEFATLEPVKTGKLKDGFITLSPAKSIGKKGFGMVFEGTMTIPESGEYAVAVVSDDGSAFNIDGETIVGNDGTHEITTQRIKHALDKGMHTFQILYFDNGAAQFLSAYIDGGTMGKVWLSEVKSEGKKNKKNATYPPIFLTAQNPNEAIVHRAFVPDANPRAIGVGYPGKVNLIWDADTLNLAYVYRGEFMDTAPHWNRRGSGSMPAGAEKVITAQGMPFQILESLEEPWVPFSEATIAYERDTSDPKEDITFNIKHPDYQFQGYRLDKNRFPTFSYQYRSLTVTDRFDPQTINGVKAIVRSIKTSGTVDENTYFRIASTGIQEKKDGWIDIGSEMAIRIEGADPVTRQVEGGKETLVLLETDTPVIITYRWNTPLQNAAVAAPPTAK